MSKQPLSGPRCPICKKPASVETRPFCSKRCRDVDLSRWLGDGYVIAGNKDADEDGDGDVAGSLGAVPDNDDD